MSDFVTTDAGLTAVASERNTPPGTKRNIVISGVEGVRGRVASEGISEHAADLVVGSWRDGTKVAYNSAWSKWGSWCNPQQIDPFQATVANVVNFLSNLHREGYEYSTIHSHRSAISSFHPVIDEIQIGQHSLVFKLLNVIVNDRPTKPRYTSTWDVKQVLDYIESLDNNDKMSIMQLAQKTAMLMALLSACRGSELQAVDIALMTEVGNQLEFQIVSLTK